MAVSNEVPQLPDVIYVACREADWLDASQDPSKLVHLCECVVVGEYHLIRKHSVVNTTTVIAQEE